MLTRSREPTIAPLLTKLVLDITYQHNDISALIQAVHVFNILQVRTRACGAHLIG